MVAAGTTSVAANAAPVPAGLHLRFDGNLDNARPSPPNVGMGSVAYWLKLLASSPS
jgi:hypothetical protein